MHPAIGRASPTQSSPEGRGKGMPLTDPATAPSPDIASTLLFERASGVSPDVTDRGERTIQPVTMSIALTDWAAASPQTSRGRGQAPVPTVGVRWGLGIWLSLLPHQPIPTP